MTSQTATPRTLRWAARSLVVVFVLVTLAGIGLAWAAADGSEAADPDPSPAPIGSPGQQDGGSGDGAGDGGDDAAEGSDREGEEAAPATEPRDQPPGATPRSTLSAFREACAHGEFAAAARFLDLSEATAEPGSTEAAHLARQLDIVLSRTVWMDPSLVRDDPEGDREDQLEPELERVGEISSEHGEVPILLVRGAGGDDMPAWRFAPYTVAAIPGLYAEHGYGWIEEILPQPFFDVVVLDVELWQWIGLILAALVASFLGFVAAVVLFGVLRPFAKRTRAQWDDWLLEGSAGPVRLGLSLGAFWMLSHVLALGVAVQGFVDSICEALAVLAVTWLVLRAVDVLARVLHGRLAARDPSAADTLVPMGRRITKVFLCALAAISMVHNLGFNAAGLLTGLGVGGLAFALAAQKTLENLFGGISVIADKPVEVGQFCRVGEHVGTVEEIGLRSTRLRTLDRTLVTIPNAEFATVRIENYAERDMIRIHTLLQLGYDTSPDQMRWVLVELKKLLVSHPRIVRDPARVRFVAFNAYSLDLEVFAYVDTMDYNEFLAVREDVYLRIIDVIAASGAYFAYPSQTLYLGRDSGRDGERTEEAEKAVRAWREGAKLPLPDLPEERAEELAGTLAYPPEGSVGNGRKG
jgi:MscS family membrane protein